MRKFLVSVAAAVLLLGACQSAALPAYLADPAHDTAHPARMEVLHIPSGGVEINGVAYLAAGEGAHPTLVIAHGWPGNEKNLDLAQAVRRAGWNAVTFNYRGSWGSPGEFHFAQVPEDAANVIAWLRTPDVAAKFGIDPTRIALAGHSMGGWATAMTASKDPMLMGAVLISAANMGSLSAMPRKMLVQASSENAETLVTTPEKMADELVAGAKAFALKNSAEGLAKLPVLVVSSDDGLAKGTDALADAIRDLGGKVETQHFATDHSYSDARLGLQAAVITWLGTLPGAK